MRAKQPRPKYAFRKVSYAEAYAWVLKRMLGVETKIVKRLDGRRFVYRRVSDTRWEKA